MSSDTPSDTPSNTPSNTPSDTPSNTPSNIQMHLDNAGSHLRSIVNLAEGWSSGYIQKHAMIAQEEIGCLRTSFLQEVEPHLTALQNSILLLDSVYKRNELLEIVSAIRLALLK